jgi:hypothetical protein
MSTNDVEALQKQVAELQSQVKPRHWVRTFWSTVLIVLACILAPLSVVSVWARGEVTDTTRYIQTVAPLAENPAIQDAVAHRITQEIFAYVNVPELTSQAVATISGNRSLTPEQTAALTALTGPLNSGIESYTRQVIDKVVQSEQFAAAWVEANTLVHQRLDAALTGETTDNAVKVESNQVVLDLGNLIGQVKQQLINSGFTIAEKIPATTNATIVLFQAPNAGTIQAGYAVLNAVGFWLPLIAITLAIVGVFVSHSRHKALAWFGFGLILAMAVGAALIGVARIGYLNALPETVSVPAATAFFDQFTLFLKQSLWAGAAGGAVIFLGGLLMGHGKVAAGLRRVPVSAAAAIQRWLASMGLTMTGARSWVAAQATGLRIALSLAALVFVMLQRYKTPELIFWTTGVLLVVLFILQIFASGDTSPEQGDSSPAEPVAG